MAALILAIIIICGIGIGISKASKAEQKSDKNAKKSKHYNNDDMFANEYERWEPDDGYDYTLVSGRERIEKRFEDDPEFRKEHFYETPEELLEYGYDEDDPDDWT